ncbi:MAG: ribosome biogenesis GTP-binding protein YihA/YsxC [Neomegalonema sp.]|nr:ribosome biogenesis GTP-binding protein YihA/YsxC [Neomegalonema sp.]
MAQHFDFSIDPDFTEDELETGRLLFARGAEFVIGCASLSQLPPGDRMEVCFAGRSNVGKSSLLNAITGRKALARTSNTPGRTQQLNYFDINSQLYVVDLPGYGYAEAPKKVVEAWQTVLHGYLAGRANLRRVFALIDGRHGIKAVDHEMFDALDRAAVPFQVILTKADKPRASELEAAIARTQEGLQRHPTAFPQIIITSSETGRGVDKVRAAIARLMSEG